MAAVLRNCPSERFGTSETVRHPEARLLRGRPIRRGCGDIMIPSILCTWCLRHSVKVHAWAEWWGLYRNAGRGGKQ